jgi:hypothetical protein
MLQGGFEDISLFRIAGFFNLLHRFVEKSGEKCVKIAKICGKSSEKCEKNTEKNAKNCRKLKKKQEIDVFRALLLHWPA